MESIHLVLMVLALFCSFLILLVAHMVSYNQLVNHRWSLQAALAQNQVRITFVLNLFQMFCRATHC